MSHTRVVVYTDGSCINNGRQNPMAGWAYLFEFDDSRNGWGRVEGRQTNNAAELWAVWKAVEKAYQLGIAKLCVKTDSQLVIDIFTDFIHTWKRNGWVTSRGAPVENQDLIKNIDAYMPLINVTFSHVRAHGDDSKNIAVDRMAKEAALSGDVIHHFNTFNSSRNFRHFLQDLWDDFSSESYDDGLLSHRRLMRLLPRDVNDPNFLRAVRRLQNRDFDFLDYAVIYQLLTHHTDNIPNSNGCKYTMLEIQRNGYGPTKEFETEIIHMGNWTTGQIHRVSSEFLRLAEIS